jgi:putative Mg2+ transporter-C (MgtC) family protein
MASGAGYYVGAVATTAAVLVSLIGFRQVRPYLLARMRTDFVLLEIEMDKDGEFAPVLEALARHGVRVEAMDSAREPELLGYRLELEVPPDATLEAAVDEIQRMPNVQHVEARGSGSPTQAGSALG